MLDPRNADARTLHIRTTLDAKCEERARTAQIGRDVLALREHRPAREPSLVRRARLRRVEDEVLSRARAVEDRGASDLRRVLVWMREGDRGARPGTWDTWETRKGRRKLGTGGPAGAARVRVNIALRLLPSQPVGELLQLDEIGHGSNGQQLHTLSFQIQLTRRFNGWFGWGQRHIWSRDPGAGTTRRVLPGFLCRFRFRIYKVLLSVSFVMIRPPQHGLPPYLSYLVQSWDVSRVAQRPRVRVHGTTLFSYSLRGGACRCEALGRLRAGQVFVAVARETMAREAMGPMANPGVVQHDWVLYS